MAMERAIGALREFAAACRQAYADDPLTWLAWNDPVRFVAVTRSMRAHGITGWAEQRAAARAAASSAPA